MYGIKKYDIKNITNENINNNITIKTNYSQNNSFKIKQENINELNKSLDNNINNSINNSYNNISKK